MRMDWRSWKKERSSGSTAAGESAESRGGFPGPVVPVGEAKAAGPPGAAAPASGKPPAPDEGAGGTVELATCPDCGARIEDDSRFCTQCSAPLTEEAGEGMADAGGPPSSAARKVSRRRAGEGPVEPWAARAGETVSRLPRGVKIGVPIAVLLVAAALVALFTLASIHSPGAAISRYLGELKVGDYKSAYGMIAHPGGRFSTYSFFRKWQDNTTEHLGRLQDYVIQERKAENRFFGRLIEPVSGTGKPFVVTMKYKDKAFDVNMVVEEAGGAWPVKRWRIKLTGRNTRLLVAPLGSRVRVDGMAAGVARADRDLADALQLKHFPRDIDGAVDYARKLARTFRYLIGEVRRLAANLEGVTEGAQGVVDKFGTGGFSWSDILDAASSTAQQGKEFGQDAARLVIQIYWIFGGGDDGSVRARLSRVQSGLELKNLPEGWHEVSARLPGATSESKEFIAPVSAELRLDPTEATERELKNTVNGYYGAVTAALATLDTRALRRSMAGPALTRETERVLDLMGKGQHVEAQLTDLRYESLKLLSERVATVETHETWNETTYQGSAVAGVKAGRKLKVVYTLEEQGGGLWKVIERKEL